MRNTAATTKPNAKLASDGSVRHLKTTGIGGADTSSAAQPVRRRTAAAVPSNADATSTSRRMPPGDKPSTATIPRKSRAAQQQLTNSNIKGDLRTGTVSTATASNSNEPAVSQIRSSTNLWGGNVSDAGSQIALADAVASKSQLFKSSDRSRAPPLLQPTVEGIWHLAKPPDDLGKDVGGIRFAENGNILACGTSDGVIRLFERKTGAQFSTLEDDDTRTNGAPVTSIRFRPLDSELAVATYADGLVKLWNCRLGKSLVTVNQDKKKALSAAFNRKGDRLAVGCDSGEIYVYDANHMRLISVLTPTVTNTTTNSVTGHTGRVFSIVYTRHSHELVSAGWDNLVHVWDDRHTGSTRHWFGPHVCGDGLDFDTDHDLVLTASWRKTDDQLQIWDYKSGELVNNVVMKDCSSSLYCAQFIGKDFILVGGSDTNCARLIQREAPFNTMARVIDLPGGIYYMDNNKAHKSTLAVPRIALVSSRFVLIMDTGDVSEGGKKKALGQVRASQRDEALENESVLPAL